MPTKCAITTGSWSTAATWGTTTNTPTIHASTNLTIAANRFTATFTAPNTTNACVGVWLFFTIGAASSGTISVTLQESTVDTAATVAQAVSSGGTASGYGSWLFFRFPTPYTFTTTSAGAYRFRVVGSGITNTVTVAADSGGTLAAFLGVDNRASAPVSGDDIWIGDVAVTVDGAYTVGAAGAWRSITGGIRVAGANAVLQMSTAVSSTLTLTGDLLCEIGGTWRAGTAASPVPAGVSATVSAAASTTLSPQSLGVFDLHGRTLTYWKTTYVSGAGTVVSPLITADPVDWSVGDEIIVAATGGVAQHDARFIITKNSPTSYVLSATAGGAAAALSFTHTAGAHIVNLTRNVQVTRTGGTALTVTLTGLGASDVDWVSVRQMNTGGVTLAASNAFDYCVVAEGGATNITVTGSGNTYAGLIAYSSGSGSSVVAGGITNSGTQNTFTDCVILYIRRFGVFIGNGSIWNNLIVSGGNYAPFSGSGGVGLVNTFGSTLNNPVVYACNGGVLLTNTASCRINNLSAGVIGANATGDVVQLSSAYTDIVFADATLASSTPISGYLLALPGSTIAFERYGGTTNNHLWYTPYGIGRSTGAGLPDTTVRTPDSLGVRLAPESTAPGFAWEFNILAKASSIVVFVGYFRRNVALGTDVATVELFLPGSTVADASYTLPTTADAWLPVVISAHYDGTVDLLATVRVTAKSVAAGAYLYADDFYNARTSNKIAGLDTWQDGKPVSFIVDTTFDPASVWSYALSPLDTPDTTGNQLRNALTVSKYLGLK